MNDYEFLRGRHNQTVDKELCVASAAAADKFRSMCPYKMAYHRSSENGLNWADGHIEYKELHTVLSESVAGFEHLYAYGVSKCTFLAGLTGRPIHNLEDLGCQLLVSFTHKRLCTLTCHKFPKFAYANKNARSLYDWLMYYLQKKDYVQCPADVTRQTAEFISALQ